MEPMTILLIITPLLYILFNYLKSKYTYWDDLGIPNVPPSIPFGNIRELGRTEQIAMLMKRFYTQMKGKGSTFGGLYFFIRPVAIALDPEFIKNVLIRDFQHFQNRGLYSNEHTDPLSANLFTIDGEKWRKLRVKLTPTFTSGKMKFMYPTIIDVGKRFQTCMADIIDGTEELEMKDLLARFTTDVIGTCAFGIECNSLVDPNVEFRRMGRKFFEAPRHGPAALFFIVSFKKLAAFFDARIVHDDVTKFFMKIVTETVEYRAKNNVKRNDFMDLLIDLKNQEIGSLSVTEIAAQAFLFFLAGFETSSTTMVFALYELALNPAIQTKLRQEIKNVIQKHNGEFSYEAMMDMVYLEQVINETLRKNPPVGVIFRSVTKDYPVPQTNHVLSKGSQVIVPVYGIHHDPAYYPEPEKFDPERFSAEESGKRDGITFLPFGDGPRNCVGLRFGLMQTRVGLVSLLLNFEFSKSAHTKVPLSINKKSIIFAPEGGMWLNVRKL